MTRFTDRRVLDDAGVGDVRTAGRKLPAVFSLFTRAGRGRAPRSAPDPPCCRLGLAVGLALAAWLASSDAHGQLTLSSVEVYSVDSVSATFYWYTNVAADTQVEYGLTSSYGSSSALDATLANSHLPAISGLSPGTLYHWRARSRDAGGNLVVSSDMTLTTLPAAYDFELGSWGPTNVYQGSHLHVVFTSRLTGGTSTNISLALAKSSASLGAQLGGGVFDSGGQLYLYGSTQQVPVDFDTTGVPAGPQWLRITGTANGVSHAYTIAFTVRTPPVAPPKPTYPVLAPVPQLAAYESNMVNHGRQHCNAQTIAANSTWEGGVWYYDGERVFYNIADYTGDPSWNACAGYVEAMYRDTYVLPNNGGIPGWRVFTTGMLMDYQRTGDAASKDGVIKLSTNSAYASPATFLPYVISWGSSRETAYALHAFMDAEDVGAPRHALRDVYVDIALGQVDQWFVSRRTNYIQPFMVGLTAESLIRHFEKTQDPRVLPALTVAADWLWANAWVPASQAFWYESYPFGGPDPGVYPTVGAPDLNLLILPMYGWLYQQTGEKKWIDRGDQIFAGGVLGAWLDGGKQFSQNYRWSGQYLKYRASTSMANPVPVLLSISPSSANAGSPAFTLTVSGSNFVGGSTVQWKGSARPTTFVSSQQLTASIPASDLTPAGTAAVTVFNPAPGGGASNAVTFAINGAGGSPAASFTFAPSSPRAGDTVQFTDASTNAPTSWSWSFGDGGTSASQNPAHVYASSGSFTVTLTARNSAGSGSTSRTLVVSASSTAPTASFTFTPSAPLRGDVVRFFDSSGGAPTSWTWRFGDGASATQQNPTHAYVSAGTYVASLTVSNANGASSSSASIVVSAAPATPSFASFTYAPSSPVVGQTVAFHGASERPALFWSWDFGDGSTSSLQNPSHTFGRVGTYPVMLTVGSATGTNTTAQYLLVRLSPPCVSDGTHLCLNGDRFEMSVDWRVPSQGTSGAGNALAVTGDTGYFWFFTPNNVELIAKVVDGRAFNGHYWVFSAALTDVEYTVRVRDSENGRVQTYFNASGTMASRADAAAFAETASRAGLSAGELRREDFPNARPSEPPGGSPPRPPRALEDSRAAADTCAAGPTTLCLNEGRFRVDVDWDVASRGMEGPGMAVPLTGDTGYFWFFSSNNVELVVKVVDGRAYNQRFWVFHGALSDVRYSITVTDTVTGTARSYVNDAGRLWSAADTSAF